MKQIIKTHKSPIVRLALPLGFIRNCQLSIINYLTRFTLIAGLLFAVIACNDDPNDAFDMRSPQAVIPIDTLEVNRGETVTLNAILSDESGILSYKLEYATWKITNEVSLRDAGMPKTYDFSADIVIPSDAATSWLENYQKHDGSIFNVTQTYHKISLTFYDAVNNKNVIYFYIKIIS